MNAAPIIVTATIGTPDFGVLDALRRAHFPPERNHLSAHLTMFHHLPADSVDEVLAVLRAEAMVLPPHAILSRLINLGGGVAFGLESPGLEQIRSCIAECFAGSLTPQDRQRWRPHVTIQNKVTNARALSLFETLSKDFSPRRIALSGLAAWWYRGGPWEAITNVPFAAAAG